MKTCHDIKGMVFDFGSFEVYKSTNFIKEFSHISCWLLKRNICLSACIDMAWLLWHTMSKPFMSWHIDILIYRGSPTWNGLIWIKGIQPDGPTWRHSVISFLISANSQGRALWVGNISADTISEQMITELFSQ